MLADLDAFVTHEVLRALTPRLLEFLQLLSICPSLDAGVAEALAGEAEGWASVLRAPFEAQGAYVTEL